MLAWAREEGEVGSVKAQLPRLAKTLIHVLSRDEIDRLEDAAKSERDKLIVRTLADTGIRVGELVSSAPWTSWSATASTTSASRGRVRRNGSCPSRVSTAGSSA
jgi:site-specific recombinase XerD